MRIRLLLIVCAAVLLWLVARGKDKYIEYPEQPEPMNPWWNTTVAGIPVNLYSLDVEY